MSEMKNFMFNLPTRIEFGLEKFKQVGREAARFGRKALIVSYRDKSLSALVVECAQLLAAESVQSVVFEEAEANPVCQIVDRGRDVAIENKCDLVIGLGGGSAMDVAKAIAVCAVEKVDIWKIVEGRPIEKKPLPLILVPTTSGTGSEVTQYAVISNRELKRKEGFGRLEFYPKVAILDPLLTVGLPPALTAATGMDALTHAIEGYTTKLTNPITDACAEKAISLIGKSIRTAVFHGTNIQARYDLMLASMLAGIAITHADTSLAHVIGEAVGAVFNTGHGLSVSLTLPAVMEYNCIADLPKFAAIAEMLGEIVDGLSLREAAMLAPGAVRVLIADLNLPQGLAQMGVSENEQVMALCCRPNMDASNLRPASRPDFEFLFRASLSPEMSYWAIVENPLNRG
jgi:alcohol dehydrogenase class IV